MFEYLRVNRGVTETFVLRKAYWTIRHHKAGNVRHGVECPIISSLLSRPKRKLCTREIYQLYWARSTHHCLCLMTHRLVSSNSSEKSTHNRKLNPGKIFSRISKTKTQIELYLQSHSCQYPQRCLIPYHQITQCHVTQSHSFPTEFHLIYQNFMCLAPKPMNGVYRFPESTVVPSFWSSRIWIVFPWCPNREFFIT